MSLNIEHLSSSMQREISRILQLEVRDEILHMVTITEVRISNDLSYATVYYTCLGSETHKIKVNDALQRANGFIRSKVAKKITSRKMPQLIFKFDDALAYGNKINQILNEIK